MNDELNTKNMENQPVEAQPTTNEVLTPDAQQPMVDPIEAPAPVEPEVKAAPEAGTFTPPVAGMVPTGWAFPQDLASSLAMTTEDPEVAATGTDEVNQPADDMDAGGPSEELPESTKVPGKAKKLSEDFEDDFEEGELEGVEEMDEPEESEEAEESEDDCEACEDLEENPEEIPDLLDTIADILRKKDLEDSEEFEEEDEEEEDESADDDFAGEDFPVEDLEMDEAVKYPAGSKPEASAEVDNVKRPLEYAFDQDDDIIRQYEKRALARKALIEKLKKPLWEKELDEIADTDERDKEEGYKSINDAIDEGSLNEKFDRALKNPLEESRKEASGWAAHNNLGRLSEKRLNFRKMVGGGFLD